MLFFSISIFSAFGQINIEDSTAQSIIYWSKGEKQSYKISHQKIKLKDIDTTSNELMTYDVDITVVDSTEKSYTIEWSYSNYQNNTSNELLKKFASFPENMKVLIQTNELGTIEGVQNWKEIRDYIKKSMTELEKEFKDVPNIDKMFKQIEGMYSSKEAIESAAIMDIQQFHSFFGGKFLLGEVLEFPLPVPSLYSSKPLDSKVTLSLDEINPDEGYYLLNSIQEVDSEQLTNTTYDYLKELSKTMGKEVPKKEDVGQLTNTTSTASSIHESGWIIYSIQTKTVTSDGATNVEERIIELK